MKTAKSFDTFVSNAALTMTNFPFGAQTVGTRTSSEIKAIAGLA